MQALPTTPECCPSSELVKLAADGSSFYCRACSRIYRASELAPDGGPVDYEELMRTSVPIDPRGSSERSHDRPEMKPGTKAWLEGRHRAIRHEQGHFGGRKDAEAEPLSKKLCLPMQESLAKKVSVLAETQGVSSQELLREAAWDLVSKAARQSLRISFPAL